MAYRRLVLGLAAGLLWSAFVSPVRAQTVDNIRAEARKFERDGEWKYACQRYHYLWKTHGDSEDRRAYLTCLRNFRRIHRHEDSSYAEVLKKDLPAAVDIYKDALKCLREGYVDESMVKFNLLLAEGLKELRSSLKDPAFCARYVDADRLEKVTGYVVDELAKFERSCADTRFANSDQLATKIRELALDVQKVLGIKPTVTVLEFACGACNALDEHTYYLPPIQFEKETASLRGEVVGIGVDIDDRMIVRHLIASGPAATAGVKVGDRLLAVNGRDVKKLQGDIQASLQGPLGSRVELKLSERDEEGNTKERTVTVTRIFPSVVGVKMLDPDAGVGYIRLVRFDDKTPIELEAAIRSLESQGMKSMILDLRGNSGGSFDSSVKVASTFLPRGDCIIQAAKGGNVVKEYTSKNKKPIELPLVLVTDKSTASAAEVVAAALEKRASIVGTPTYGKGTQQGLRKLHDQDSGGVRVTMHNLLSPHGQSIQGVGVLPKHPAKPEAAEDIAIEVAKDKTREKD